MLRLSVGVLGMALAVAVAPVAAVAQSTPPVASAPFDYYVMTLSWAPGFCDLGGQETSSPECASGSAAGFVVHGLWPDNDYRPNPESCQGQDATPADIADEHGLYPNDSLAAYEYRKHGTCTGLSAHDYFATVRNVRQRLVIPVMFQAVHQPLHVAPEDIEQQRRAHRRALLHRPGSLVLCHLPQGRPAQLPAGLDRGRAGALKVSSLVVSADQAIG